MKNSLSVECPPEQSRILVNQKNQEERLSLTRGKYAALACSMGNNLVITFDRLYTVYDSFRRAFVQNVRPQISVFWQYTNFLVHVFQKTGWPLNTIFLILVFQDR